MRLKPRIDATPPNLVNDNLLWPLQSIHKDREAYRASFWCHIQRLYQLRAILKGFKLHFLQRILCLKQSGLRSQHNMAWRCSGNTNEELINNLFKNGLIKSRTVKSAMSKVRLLTLSLFFTNREPLETEMYSLGWQSTLLPFAQLCIWRFPPIHRSRCNNIRTTYACLGLWISSPISYTRC